MGKIFRICASPGEKNDMELDLPVSGYEMLDLMERLRLSPGQQPYVKILNISEEYGYLEKFIHGQPDIYRLNVLAEALSAFSGVGKKAAFEGLVGKELQDENGSVDLNRLIDFACSTRDSTLMEDIMTDDQLGRTLVENGLVAEANGLPDSVRALLDFGKIGRQRREEEGGIFTACGYVEVCCEENYVSRALDVWPRKPPYTIQLNIAVRPLPTGVQPEMLQLRLPAPENQIREAMDKLGAKSWDQLSVSILDCSIPYLNHHLYLNGEMPQIVELAERLRELDERGELTKYKAVLEANNWPDLAQMLPLMDTMDNCFFEPQTSSPEEVAREELSAIVCSPDMEALLPHLDLAGYGRALLEREHAMITTYGLLEQRPCEQVQDMERTNLSEGMVMA